MPRVAGIDPGTMSFDFFGLDDERIILDTSIPTKRIASDPESVVDKLEQIDPEFIVGPSGYGIPVKRISDITHRDIFLMSLVRRDDDKSILGMRRFIEVLREHNLPVYFIPGVIHLPTVPAYRKINRIDMGTPDKLCACALAIRDQASRFEIDYDQTSFILLEMGFAHTAAIAVDSGMVVDGIGGSSGGIGFLSMGGMDAELAYLLGGFRKKFITSRGARLLAGGDIMPEDLAMHDDAWCALIEGAVKNVLALTSSLMPEEVLLSGRISGITQIRDELAERLEMVAPVRLLKGFSGVEIAKESAQGAALIANGLSHGRYENIVRTMRIEEAHGTVLDFARLDDVKITQ